MHARPHVGPTYGYTKCSAYEGFYANSPWGLGAGCKRLQIVKGDFQNKILSRATSKLH